MYYWHPQSGILFFFCPCDLVSQGYSFLPVQLLAAGMKEVTRTWKIVGGVTHANSRYKNGWLVMIAIGWARGAGGSIITNFELLVKGDWKPQADEWMKMSYPAKVTLLGSIIFTFQHTEHLLISRHNLMFLYTVFLVATKIIMMTTATPVAPFAPFEAIIRRILFGWQQQFLPCEKKSDISTLTSKSSAVISDKVKKKGNKKND